MSVIIQEAIDNKPLIQQIVTNLNPIQSILGDLHERL